MMTHWVRQTVLSRKIAETYCKRYLCTNFCLVEGMRGDNNHLMRWLLNEPPKNKVPLKLNFKVTLFSDSKYDAPCSIKEFFAVVMWKKYLFTSGSAYISWGKKT